MNLQIDASKLYIDLGNVTVHVIEIANPLTLNILLSKTFIGALEKFDFLCVADASPHT